MYISRKYISLSQENSQQHDRLTKSDDTIYHYKYIVNYLSLFLDEAW